MSIRWMAVQFVGDTLRLPIVNKPDMDKPFGSSELEREVRRIVVNPFSDNPQTFVPEAEIIRCKDCKHAHITVDGRSNKWCDCIATHSPEDWSADPPNGYDPEPYFDVDFFCAWGKRREDA